jgi:hypothetical protein
VPNISNFPTVQEYYLLMICGNVGIQTHNLFFCLKGITFSNIEASLSAGAAKPGPAGHFWPTRTFRMALEEIMIEPDRKIVM